MAMHMSVSYIPSAKSSREYNGDIIMFAQFEESTLLSQTHDDAESGENIMTIQLCHH